VTRRPERGTDAVPALGSDADPGALHDGFLPESLQGALTDEWYRLLHAYTTDVVFEVGFDWTIRWISPSVEHVLGWTPESLVGGPVAAIWHPDDGDLRDRIRTHLWAGRRIDDVECRIRHRDGEWRWVSAQLQPVAPPGEPPSAAIVSVRDIHTEVTAGRALATLSAANAILVRADDEAQLLGAMCQAAVDAGGYVFAWYGRPAGGPTARIAAVASSFQHREYLDDIEVSYADDPLGQGPAGRALRTGATATASDVEADAAFLPWRDAMRAHAFRSAVGVPVTVDGTIDGVLMVYAAEAHAFDDTAVGVLEDVASQLGFGLGRIRELGRLARSMAAQSALRAALDQTEEAVVVADDTSTILYANPAAARISGRPMEEMVGLDTIGLRAMHHDPSFFSAVHADIQAGSWRGSIVTERPDGEPIMVDGIITPVMGSDGAPIAYVAVMRDAVPGRDEPHDRELRRHVTVTEVLDRVRPAATIAETAEVFCEAVETVAAFDGAMVLMFQDDGTAVPYASGSRPPPGMEPGTPIEIPHMGEALARTRSGPWMVDYADPETRDLFGPDVYDVLVSFGLTASAYAPIRWGGAASGVLAVSNRTTDGPRVLAEHLPMLGELGSFAALLFGAQAEQFSAAEHLLAAVRALIDERAFDPVFQPVIDTTTGEPFGYEALTRFHDRVRADRHFADAHAVGLGSELEGVCARAALDAAADLPVDVWVALNFSPAAVLDGTAARIVRGRERPIVIEVTEHAQIESYVALRQALAECGEVRLSVDDAGAGYASLRHILELRPHIVKLDLGLVRDIDTDVARQALAAGLCEFAEQTGTLLIAEGVETTSEAEAVHRLGVRYVQGYLYGRPGPLPGR